MSFISSITGVYSTPTTIAHVPRFFPSAGAPPSQAPTRRDAEALRLLEGKFREVYTHAFPEIEKDTRLIVGVTSAIRREGRTSTALGLALAIARDQVVRVLVVELDLEHPTLGRELHLPEGPGVVDVFSGNAELSSALCSLPSGMVDVLPCGSRTDSVSRVLRSEALREFLVTAPYRVVILDLPPALDSSDIVPLGELTDGIVLVVRAGATPARVVDQAVARFPQGKVRGIVLNTLRTKIPTWLRYWI